MTVAVSDSGSIADERQKLGGKRGKLCAEVERESNGGHSLMQLTEHSDKMEGKSAIWQLR